MLKHVTTVLLQVGLVHKSKLLGIVVAELLQAGCPSCHPTNSIKTLKDDSVTDWRQHAATMPAHTYLLDIIHRLLSRQVPELDVRVPASCY